MDFPYIGRTKLCAQQPILLSADLGVPRCSNSFDPQGILVPTPATLAVLATSSSCSLNTPDEVSGAYALSPMTLSQVNPQSLSSGWPFTLTVVDSKKFWETKNDRHGVYPVPHPGGHDLWELCPWNHREERPCRPLLRMPFLRRERLSHMSLDDAASSCFVP